jgi:hypothetical protein
MICTVLCNRFLFDQYLLEFLLAQSHQNEIMYSMLSNSICKVLFVFAEFNIRFMSAPTSPWINTLPNINFSVNYVCNPVQIKILHTMNVKIYLHAHRH